MVTSPFNVKTAGAPDFDDAFRAGLRELFTWRRDVRRFRTEPLVPQVLERLLDLACLAPSVGNSQPWRFVTVDASARRAAVRADFARCNAEALAGYCGEQAARYAALKLAGLDDAPVQLAVFADRATESGHGLGRRTMPETLAYSVVTAVHTLWLAARAEGIGVGWLSIIDPAAVATILETPKGWSLVAYLCIGHPQEEHGVPELERHDWQGRDAACRKVLSR